MPAAPRLAMTSETLGCRCDPEDIVAAITALVPGLALHWRDHNDRGVTLELDVPADRREALEAVLVKHRLACTSNSR